MPPDSTSGSGTTNQQQTTPNTDTNTETDKNTAKTAGKTGVGMVISMEGTRGATESSPAVTQSEITVCAASFDKDGKILDVVFDVAEPGVEYDDTGALTTDLSQPVMTKRQLGGLSLDGRDDGRTGGERDQRTNEQLGLHRCLLGVLRIDRSQ